MDRKVKTKTTHTHNYKHFETGFESAVVVMAVWWEGVVEARSGA